MRQDGDECLISALAETFRCFADDDNEMDADVEPVHFKVEWYKRGAISLFTRMSEWCMKHSDLGEENVMWNYYIDELGIELDKFVDGPGKSKLSLYSRLKKSVVGVVQKIDYRDTKASTKFSDLDNYADWLRVLKICVGVVFMNAIIEVWNSIPHLHHRLSAILVSLL